MSKQKPQPKREALSTDDPSPGPISFRLDSLNYKLLEERAAQENLSPNLAARAIVLNALNQEEDDAVQEQLAAVDNGMADLRKDLQLIAETLLLAIVTGKKMTAADVKAWVASNLKQS